MNLLHALLASNNDELSRRELAGCLALRLDGTTSESEISLALSVLKDVSTVGSVLDPPLISPSQV